MDALANLTLIKYLIIESPFSGDEKQSEIGGIFNSFSISGFLIIAQMLLALGLFFKIKAAPASGQLFDFSISCNSLLPSSCEMAEY